MRGQREENVCVAPLKKGGQLHLDGKENVKNPGQPVHFSFYKKKCDDT